MADDPDIYRPSPPTMVLELNIQQLTSSAIYIYMYSFLNLRKQNEQYTHLVFLRPYVVFQTTRWPKAMLSHPFSRPRFFGSGRAFFP